MNLIAIFVGIPYVAVFVLLSIYFFKRALWRHKRRAGRANGGFYPSSLSLGNALQSLQSFTRPNVDYFLAEKYDEDADEDDSGGPDGNPEAHLKAQLRRIRRGERVDVLTVRLR